MEWNLYLAFVAATLVLCIIPGPVVTFLVATGISHGPRAALIGLAGSTTALTIHMLLVIAGMAPLLAALGEWADGIKFIGALYLIWLGIAAWRMPITSLDIAASPVQPSPARLYRHGLLISLTNPKTLVFYAAFFPQFITTDQPQLTQMILLTVTFVTLGALSDGTFGVAAGHLAPYLKSPRAQKIRNHVTGSALVAAGLALAASRR